MSTACRCKTQGMHHLGFEILAKGKKGEVSVSNALFVSPGKSSPKSCFAQFPPPPRKKKIVPQEQ